MIQKELKDYVNFLKTLKEASAEEGTEISQLLNEKSRKSLEIGAKNGNAAVFKNPKACLLTIQM